MLALPKVALTASDYPRLDQLARAAWKRGDRAALLLPGEINVTYLTKARTDATVYANRAKRTIDYSSGRGARSGARSQLRPSLRHDREGRRGSLAGRQDT